MWELLFIALKMFFFKEILEQMPDVTKYLSGFQTPIPKMYFSTFRIKEWEGKTTDSE